MRSVKKIPLLHSTHYRAINNNDKPQSPVLPFGPSVQVALFYAKEDTTTGNNSYIFCPFLFLTIQSIPTSLWMMILIRKSKAGPNSPSCIVISCETEQKKLRISSYIQLTLKHIILTYLTINIR